MGDHLRALVENLLEIRGIGDETRVRFAADVVEGVLSGQSLVVRFASEVSGARLENARVFLDKVMRVSSTLESSRQEDAISKLADLLLPDDLADARGVLAADNLALRDEFLRRVPAVRSIEVGRRAGHSDSNLHATAARWKKAQDIFSVHHRGAEYFPSFQFGDDGRPLRIVKSLLGTLPRSLTPWQIAFWFVSTNGWLNDRAPVDVLDDAKAVLAAASRESEQVMG